MREIKFRAWTEVDMCGWDEASFKWFSDNKFIVMQYTGLKDKNSVEIYEGDVLITSLPESRMDSLGVVEFVDGCFYRTIEPYITYPQMKYTFINTGCCEVIGNIYENPELLKAGS